MWSSSSSSEDDLFDEPELKTTQVDKILITSPSLASVLSLCCLGNGNGIAVWVGKVATTTKNLITDANATATKTETSVLLRAAIPMTATCLDLSEIKLSLPPDVDVLGVIRFRNSKRFFSLPTSWDYEFCHRLKNNRSHFVGPTFIFTSVCKVGKSTKLFNFIVDEEQNVFKFTPAILQVGNLADSQPVAFTESAITRFTSQLVQSPTEAHPDVGLQNVEVVFDEFRRRLGEANDRFEEARKRKLELEELSHKLNGACLAESADEEKSVANPPTVGGEKRRFVDTEDTSSACNGNSDNNNDNDHPETKRLRSTDSMGDEDPPAAEESDPGEQETLDNEDDVPSSPIISSK